MDALPAPATTALSKLRTLSRLQPQEEATKVRIVRRSDVETRPVVAVPREQPFGAQAEATRAR